MRRNGRGTVPIAPRLSPVLDPASRRSRLEPPGAASEPLNHLNAVALITAAVSLKNASSYLHLMEET